MVGQLLSYLDKRRENPPSVDELAQYVYPGIKPDLAKRRIFLTVHKAREVLKGSGVYLMTIFDNDAGLTKYSLVEHMLPSIPPLIPAVLPVEAVKSDETPEFGNLSKADISRVAAAVHAHQNLLRTILDQTGVKLIEDEYLHALIELMGDQESANLEGVKPEDRTGIIKQCRIRALEKIQQLLESPDMELTLEQIYKQNPEVWCLLVNLSEMDKVKVVNGHGTRQGIDFLMELLVNPGEVIDVVKEVKEPTEPPRPSGLETKTGSILPDANLSISVSVPEEPLPIVPAVESGIVPPVVHKTVTVIQPEIRKPKAIEQRDPDLRNRLNQYLDEILSKPDLHEPVTSMAMNREFQELKRSVVEDLVLEKRFVGISYNKDGHPIFDAAAIATLLYLYHQGKNLPPQLKRQVQDIAKDEYLKRQM